MTTHEARNGFPHGGARRQPRRQVAALARGTLRPVTSAGGTYAKRFVWFRLKPHPGHAADEHISLADLDAGVRILLEALGDLACSPPLQRPFER